MARWWLLASCLLAFVEAKGGELMGPYEMLFSRFGECKNVGTGDMRLSVVLHRKSKFLVSADFNLTLNTPIDDELTVLFKMEKQIKENKVFFMSKSFGNLCSTGMKLVPDFMKDLTAALKVPTRCPIKKGFYSVNGFTTHLNHDIAPTMFYNKYILTYLLKKKGKNIGCFIADINIVPKT